MYRCILPFLICIAAADPCSAQRDVISVVKQGSVKSTIDLRQLKAGPGSAALTFKKVLADDLNNSGWFAVSETGRGASFALRGSCTEAGRTLNIALSAVNLATGQRRLSESRKVPESEARRTAHLIADRIVEVLKGKPGIASTRIVMIGTPTGHKEVFVSDYDGKGRVQLTQDKSISVAPEWMSDSQGLVYTSFRTTFPYIYSIDLKPAKPRRTRLTKFPGLNVCASISSDGRNMAMALSKDGNPDLYSMNLLDRSLTRITRTPRAAEASPSWAPDGKSLVFVSDRHGRPHLYICRRDGSNTRRLTVKGSENVAPDWGPSGLIAYSSRRQGSYRIVVVNPKSGEESEITTDYADYEDPSWAPDGRHLVCSRTERYQSDLYILDTMGDPPIRLTSGRGDWYSPAWSPQ